MDFKKYISKEHIERVAKVTAFPNHEFIELLIHDYRIFYEIVKLKKKFILKGGAAAQLYIPLEKQRASIDIDLITDLSKDEVKKIMEALGAKEYEPKKVSKDLPLKTYVIDVESSIREKSPRQIKIDVLTENLNDYKINNVKDIELFILKLDFEMPVISKGSLIADKLLTLARKSVGIRDKEKIKEIPKHIYDILELCVDLKIEDITSLLFSFEKIAISELKYRKLKFPIQDILNHIEETLNELCSIDTKDNDIKKNLNRFTSAYLNKPSKLTTEEWVVGGLKLKLLLNQIKDAVAKTKSVDNMMEEIKRVRASLADIDKMGIEDKKRHREKLIEEVRDKLPNWKHLKTRTEERMFLELELVGDDCEGLMKRFIFRVLNREKFDRITGLSVKDREVLRELLREYFENKIDFESLVRKMVIAFPQKKPYLSKFVATTEISKIKSLARMEELKARKEKYCYVELSKNSAMCSDCERLIDGKVFRIETLEKNIYANYDRKPTHLWKPTVPLHPNCNHKIRPLIPSEKKKITDVPEDGLKISL